MATSMLRLARCQQASLLLFLATFYFFAGARAQLQGSNLTSDEVSNMIIDDINQIQVLGQTFAASFFSDLSPFIVLFGDQMVRNFMLQSNCWADYVVFSMGPLGLAMAIITAVRLCGPQYLKGVVGQGRETRQQVELELTLSTSESVCEVWDGTSIVRAIGGQEITELRIEHLPNETLIRPLRATQNGVQRPPNLSLNATGEDIPHVAKWSLAIISFILQLCVIAYAGVVQFYLPKPRFQKDGHLGSYKLYPFLNVLFGTFSMNFSMLLCSYAIDKAMHRQFFDPYTDEPDNQVVQWRPCWIQKHGKAGDQFFDSYLIIGTPRSSKGGGITTLHPHTNESEERLIPPHLKLCVIVAIILGIGGFFAQVTGLRELHFSVPAVVLGQTLLMTLLRACIQLKRNKNKDKVHIVKLPQDLELEWLATRVDSLWDELHGLDDKHADPSLTRRVSSWTTYMFWRRDRRSQGTNVLSGTTNSFWGLGYFGGGSGVVATTIPESMRRLISLKKLLQSHTEWGGQPPDLVTALLKSMKYALNTLLPPNVMDWESRFGIVGPEGSREARKVLSHQVRNTHLWKCPIPVNIWCGPQLVPAPVELTFERRLQGGWFVAEEEVESLFSLWLFNLGQRCKDTTTLDSIRLMGSNNARTRWDISKWDIDHCAQLYEARILAGGSTISPEDIQEVQFAVGFVGTSVALASLSPDSYSNTASDSRAVTTFRGRILPQSLEEHTTNEGVEYPFLATRTECTLERLCAQELFVRLIAVIGEFMHEDLQIRVGGQTTLAFPKTADADASPMRELESTKFHNSTLDKLAVEIYNTDLCSSIEAAYHLVIPPLCQAKVLPEVGGVICDHATQIFKGLVERDQWLVAADCFRWVYNSMGKTFDCESEERINAIVSTINFIEKLHKEANSEPNGSRRGKKLAERAEAMVQELTAGGINSDDVWTVGLMLDTLQKLDDNMETWLIYQMRSNTEREDGRILRQKYSRDGIAGDPRGSTLANVFPKYRVVDTKTAQLRDILRRLPLHYAATDCNLSMEKLEVIIELTRGVDQRDIDDNTPLHLAASSGNVEFIELLQKKLDAIGPDEQKLEVDFNAVNNLKQTPLHRAAAKGHGEMVETLLSKGASVELKDVSGRTALHYAALGGSKLVVEALLAKRANPAAVDIYGRSPLHIAAAAGHTVMVHRLIESGGGALLKMTDKDGKTALDLVTDNAKQKIADFEDNSPEDTPSELYDLHDLLKELLITEEGRNRGWSPLHYAVHSGEKTAVEALLKLDSVIASGGEPLLNLRDNDGATPLHVAARAGHWELVKLLIEKNCDLYSKDHNGEGALMLAVKHEHADVVKVLLKKMNSDGGGGGRDVVSKERNSMGINPLHWAAAHGNYALVVTLVHWVGGAELKDCDKLGMTALHYAALMGHENIAEYLLEQSLDLVDMADMAGGTPLHCAAAGGRVRIVELLLDNFFGEDQVLIRDGNNDIYLRNYIMEQNNAGETALHCAARGIISSHFRRMATFYNGTTLEPSMFKKSDSTTKMWLRNVISRLYSSRPELHGNEITAEELDGLYEGSRQWQDEFVRLQLRVNGDYDEWDLEGDVGAVALLLLQHGADIEAIDGKGESPLHLAARWGRFAVAKTILQSQEPTPAGYPPTESFIWRKAYVNAQDRDGDTPLHLAARWGHEDIVKLLMDEGANFEEKNVYQQSPAEVAKSHLQFEVIDLLQQGRHSPVAASERDIDSEFEIIDVPEQERYSSISKGKAKLKSGGVDALQQERRSSINKPKFEGADAPQQERRSSISKPRFPTAQGEAVGSTDTTMAPGPASTTQGGVIGSTDTIIAPRPTSTVQPRFEIVDAPQQERRSSISKPKFEMVDAPQQERRSSISKPKFEMVDAPQQERRSSISKPRFGMVDTPQQEQHSSISKKKARSKFRMIDSPQQEQYLLVRGGLARGPR